MPYCAGQSEARLYFQYPSSAEENFLSTSPPVDYSIESVNPSPTDPYGGKGQCDAAIYDVVYTVWPHWAVDGEKRHMQVYGPIGETFVRYTRTENFSTTGPREVYKLGFYCRNYWNYGLQPFPYEVSQENSYRLPDGSLPRIRIDSITRPNGAPDNCGNQNSEQKYKFTITDARGVVFTRTATEQPTVRVVCGKKCPPNTCECSCGDMTCCYNDQGYAIYSFPSNS